MQLKFDSIVGFIAGFTLITDRFAIIATTRSLRFYRLNFPYGAQVSLYLGKVSLQVDF